jgi:hypothetical protein
MCLGLSLGPMTKMVNAAKIVTKTGAASSDNSADCRSQLLREQHNKRRRHSRNSIIC